MIDFTKPVQTTDGRKVRIIATDVNHDRYPVVGVVIADDDTETVETFTAGGRYYSETIGDTSVLDLVNVVEKRTLWLNLYPQHREAYHYDTESDADKAAASNRLGGKAFPVECTV